MKDVVPPRVSPRWEDPRTVAGFTSSAPNANLVAFARRMIEQRRDVSCLDIGCGAARNALPLAEMGLRVTATDLSVPMLDAARGRIAGSAAAARVELVHAPMAPLPFKDKTFDLVVAHGIWNLARSGGEFRAAVLEAARVAKPDAALFLFTFSRRTLPADARPDSGETFLFSSWHAVANGVCGGVAERTAGFARAVDVAREGHGEPNCFLTQEQIFEEMARAGFVRDSAAPLAEYNVPRPGEIRSGGPPVIYEGTFVRRR
jgi:ubiquinone/menaquinone biosynthesis C-methylase UbiE